MPFLALPLRDKDLGGETCRYLGKRSATGAVLLNKPRVSRPMTHPHLEPSDSPLHTCKTIRHALNAEASVVKGGQARGWGFFAPLFAASLEAMKTKHQKSTGKQRRPWRQPRYVRGQLQKEESVVVILFSKFVIIAVGWLAHQEVTGQGTCLQNQI